MGSGSEPDSIKIGSKKNKIRPSKRINSENGAIVVGASNLRSIKARSHKIQIGSDRGSPGDEGKNPQSLREAWAARSPAGDAGYGGLGARGSRGGRRSICSL